MARPVLKPQSVKCCAGLKTQPGGTGDHLAKARFAAELCGDKPHGFFCTELHRGVTLALVEQSPKYPIRTEAAIVDEIPDESVVKRFACDAFGGLFATLLDTPTLRVD